MRDKLPVAVSFRPPLSAARRSRIRVLRVTADAAISAVVRSLARRSAWFSFDDDVRGSLEVGKLADLAVLSDDYLTVPLDQIGNLESVLTLLGGKVVYTVGEFAALEK